MSQQAFEKFTPVTEEEICAYLGFCILMAVNQLPSITDYWRTDEVYHYAPVANRISRDRFLDITRYLHFTDNRSLPSRTDPTYDRLQKVRPVIDVVFEACTASYDPTQNITVDEAMIALKGRFLYKTVHA